MAHREYKAGERFHGAIRDFAGTAHKIDERSIEVFKTGHICTRLVGHAEAIGTPVKRRRVAQTAQTLRHHRPLERMQSLTRFAKPNTLDRHRIIDLPSRWIAQVP